MSEIDAIDDRLRMAAERAGCLAAEADQLEEGWARRWASGLREAAREMFKVSADLAPTIETLLAEREREVREACAKVAEAKSVHGLGNNPYDNAYDDAAQEIAAAIRGSGK